MASSYDKVKGSKLTFKGGGLGLEKKITKKTKKKKPNPQEGDDKHDVESGGEDPVSGSVDTSVAKKSTKYEELFPVETKRHGYVVPTVDSRQAALDERVKKKADRYCK